MKRLIALAALPMLAACGEDPTANTTYTPPEAETTPAVEEPLADAGDPTLVSLSDEDKGRVCRAAIASLNGRDPAIIRVISSDNGLYRVRYTRDDGTVWTNECSVAEGSAQWRMVENGQPGRWRYEDTVRFTVDGPTISINTFMNGEPMTSDTYEVE
jgi:hypothetical protein